MNNNTHWCGDPQNHCSYLPRAIQRLRRIMSDPNAAKTCAELLDYYGDRFAVFLLAAEHVDLDGNLGQQIDAADGGKFDDWQELRKFYADFAGWQTAIDALTDVNGKAFSEYLQWNDEAIRERLHKEFQIVETDDRLWLFYRVSNDPEQ